MAKAVEAKAEVPLALANALREGKIGVIDYYNMKNLAADTDMRDAITNTGKTNKWIQVMYKIFVYIIISVLLSIHGYVKMAKKKQNKSEKDQRIFRK